VRVADLPLIVEWCIEIAGVEAAGPAMGAGRSTEAAQGADRCHYEADMTWLHESHSGAPPAGASMQAPDEVSNAHDAVSGYRVRPPPVR
jgi:hypothetical protein